LLNKYGRKKRVCRQLSEVSADYHAKSVSFVIA